MIKLPLTVVVILIGLLFGSSSITAQENNYWLQIESFSTLGEAKNLVIQLSDQVSKLRIFRSIRGRYLVVTGRYSKSVAAQLRAGLASKGVIGESTNITTGQHFRDQFPPVDPDLASTPENDAKPRVSELSVEDAIRVQNALTWYGDYTGAIDGIIGPQTRKAFKSYQERLGETPDRPLNRFTIRALMRAYEEELEVIGLQPVVRRAAGLSIEIPTAMLVFDRVEDPFVYFGPSHGNQIQLFLISMPGNSVTLATLYQSLGSLDFIPPRGTGSIESDHFVLRSEDETIHALADVRLFEGRIKGYLLLWHPRQNSLMARVTNIMSDSLQEISVQTLSIPTSDSSQSPSSSPLVELNIPRPKRRISGFFVDNQGSVVTSSVIADDCGKVFVAPSHEMRLVAVDAETGIALISPVTNHSPLAYARLRSEEVSKGESVNLSGYSFGGELALPSQTEMTWIGPDPRNPNFTEWGVVAGLTYPSDIGGPILDHSGSVAGILIDNSKSMKKLPEGFQIVARPSAISRLAAKGGVAAQFSFASVPLDQVRQTRNANDLTVLVECY